MSRAGGTILWAMGVVLLACLAGGDRICRSARAQGDENTCIVCGKDPRDPIHGPGEGQHKFRKKCDVRVDDIVRGPRPPQEDRTSIEKYEAWLRDIDATEKLEGPVARAISRQWRDPDSDESEMARFEVYTTVVWSANVAFNLVWAVEGSTFEQALINFVGTGKPRTTTAVFELDSRDIFGGARVIELREIRKDVVDRGKMFTITRGELEKKIAKFAKDKGMSPATGRNGAPSTAARAADQFAYAKRAVLFGLDINSLVCDTDSLLRAGLTENIGDTAVAVSQFARSAYPNDFVIVSE